MPPAKQARRGPSYLLGGGLAAGRAHPACGVPFLAHLVNLIFYTWYLVLKVL